MVIITSKHMEFILYHNIVFLYILIMNSKSKVDFPMIENNDFAVFIVSFNIYDLVSFCDSNDKQVLLFYYFLNFRCKSIY